MTTRNNNESLVDSAVNEYLSETRVIIWGERNTEYCPLVHRYGFDMWSKEPEIQIVLLRHRLQVYVIYSSLIEPYRAKCSCCGNNWKSININKEKEDEIDTIKLMNQ